MGLIDLKTDLKSLRYGKDTIGGGYSGQPYIQKSIPDSFNDLGADEDFILRGGINAIGDAATDIKRLTKMFFDLKSPNGLLFITKQNLLSQTAVRTQTTDIINEGIYTPLNTLAQAGVVELGGHLNKQGENPFNETGAYANSDILYSVKVKPSQLIEENRLARLYQNVRDNASSKLDGFILNNGPQNILTYNGGPNSILGAGQTNIRYSSFRTGKQNSQFVANPNFFKGKNNQRSVNIDDKQVGGLQVDNNKPWIKGEIVFGNGDSFYIDELPSFNVNSPQSSSLSNIPYGPLTWTAKSNISSSYVVNGQFSRYNPLLTGISEVYGPYDLIFGVNTIEISKRDFNGNPLWYNNVYKSGSLEINSEVTGSNTWTPPQIDRVNPYGSNYRIGTDKSIVYNVSQSKGVTNLLGLDQPVFVNPNVYQTGSGILVPNTKKTLQNDTITYNTELLTKQQPYTQTGKLVDFRKTLRESITNPTEAETYLKSGNIVPLDYVSYSDKNIGVKNLIGNPGADRKNKNYSDFSKGVRNNDNSIYKALDLINASKVGDDLSNDDLIQFRIQSLFTGGSTLVFRAFLGGITDTYNASINAQQYTGRGENFYTYSGQTRKISLSWTIAALSREELLPMYKKLSYLAGMTAPKYVDGFMQGPLVNLTVGGYIYNLPGYIEGFSVDIAEDATWDIAITPNGNKDNTISQLPHVVKVSGFNFTPIPDYLPQTGARFISIVNPAGQQL